MQLSQLIVRTPQPIDPTPANPTQPLLGGLGAMLRGPRAGASSPAAEAEAPRQPLGDTAREGAALLMGKVGTAQNRAIESQQLIAGLSAMFTQNMAMLGKHAWALLRGTATPGQ